MKWFWAMALAVLGWWGWQQLHGPVAPSAPPQHAAVTHMAKNAEAQAQQAAAAASRDTVADYEKSQQ